MLVELAAFNAAYATVKATLSAGRDIADCAAGIGKMMSAEADLKEKASKKKDSIWFALAGKDTNDLKSLWRLKLFAINALNFCKLFNSMAVLV